MGDDVSILAEVDRLCGQVAIALHNAEYQTYAVLTLMVLLSVLLFPPRDDFDQV